MQLMAITPVTVLFSQHAGIALQPEMTLTGMQFWPMGMLTSVIWMPSVLRRAMMSSVKELAGSMDWQHWIGPVVHVLSVLPPVGRGRSGTETEGIGRPMVDGSMPVGRPMLEGRMPEGRIPDGRMPVGKSCRFACPAVGAGLEAARRARALRE